MISVLIVDDEYLIRSLIRNSISWEQYGLEVVGEAGDGEEALAFIETHRPQIAMVDINMPILNGLELARKIQERGYHTRIIFLTGYRDFEYAKQAVTYQAFDYLLKPVSTEEMISALSRLRREIEAEAQVSAHVQTIERQSDRGRQLLQEHFLHQLAFRHRHQTAAQTAAELRRLEIPLEPNDLQALVAEIEMKEADWDDGLYVYAVLNILCELLREDGNFLHISGISEVDNCAVVLYNVKNGRALRDRVRRVWEKLTETVERYFPFSIAGGVSAVFQGYDGIGGAVKSAMEALGGRFYQTEETIFFAGSRTGGAGLAGTFSSVNLEELQMCVDAGEREEGVQIIRDVFLQMRQERVQEPFYRMAALGLLAILYSLAAKYKVSLDIIQGDGAPISEQIDKSATCYEIEELLLSGYGAVMDAIQDARKVSKLVSAAQDYIKENYRSSDLTLKKIAAAVFATPAYVSSLFKKEMGVSVTEYITICRMKEAVGLLNRDPGISLTAVSERVGYTDPYYFSRYFKKYYGVTPSKLLTNHAGTKNLIDK